MRAYGLVMAPKLPPEAHPGQPLSVHVEDLSPPIEYADGEVDRANVSLRWPDGTIANTGYGFSTKRAAELFADGVRFALSQCRRLGPDFDESPPPRLTITYTTGTEGWSGEPSEDERHSFATYVAHRLSALYPHVNVFAEVSPGAHSAVRIGDDGDEEEEADLCRWISTDVWADWLLGARAPGTS